MFAFAFDGGTCAVFDLLATGSVGSKELARALVIKFLTVEAVRPTKADTFARPRHRKL